MNKPSSWGKGLLLVYVLFVVAILSMVGYVSFQRVDLVAHDYYDREIRYQQQIDRMARRDSLRAQVTCVYHQSHRQVNLKFPDAYLSKSIQGTIQLFRPSDARMDRRVPITIDETGMQSLDVRKLTRGSWKLLLDWRADTLDFYQEEMLFFE